MSYEDYLKHREDVATGKVTEELKASLLLENKFCQPGFE